MPELRAGNASIRARGDERLSELQVVAATQGQWLPVDARGDVTIAELCASRDGGPREARYGALRTRVLSLSSGGLRFGGEAVKDVAGYDVRRAWLGTVEPDEATLRLAALPAWRSDALLRGGDAFALAASLRGLASAPAAIVVLARDLVAISDDAPRSEVERRERDLAAVAASAGAVLEPLGRAGWSELCDALPSARARLSGDAARERLPELAGRWAYDAGRRLALVEPSELARIAPRPACEPAAAALVARVREALAP